MCTHLLPFCGLLSELPVVNLKRQVSYCAEWARAIQITKILKKICLSTKHFSFFSHVTHVMSTLVNFREQIE